MPTIKGKVRSLNLSPKGVPESLLLDDGKRIVQINFERGGRHAANGLKPGQVVSVKAKSHDDERSGDHPVFCWIEEKKAGYQGVVKQINYALHGEPNGAILTSGEFVHMHPAGARAVKLKVGQPLSVEGEATTSPDGQVVIEAHVVNGLALGKHGKKAKKHAA